ncbi:MAG: helix-turn-helix domain-containing protein, partial [Lachnospiraceae bacterium]|nr:helix-turn-helix domain-containing protein [Lachnospiraceae bacterium]
SNVSISTSYVLTNFILSLILLFWFYYIFNLNSQCIIQNSRTIILKKTKQELADLFGVQRTSISREFTRMEKDGLIIIDRNNNIIELLK